MEFDLFTLLYIFHLNQANKTDHTAINRLMRDGVHVLKP